VFFLSLTRDVHIFELSYLCFELHYDKYGEQIITMDETLVKIEDLLCKDIPTEITEGPKKNSGQSLVCFTLARRKPPPPGTTDTYIFIVLTLFSWRFENSEPLWRTFETHLDEHHCTFSGRWYPDDKTIKECIESIKRDTIDRIKLERNGTSQQCHICFNPGESHDCITFNTITEASYHQSFIENAKQQWELNDRNAYEKYLKWCEMKRARCTDCCAQ
jgi:hypothetical protein